MTILFRYFFVIVFISGFLNAQDAEPDAYQDSLQKVIDNSTSKAVKKASLFLLGEHLVQRNPEFAEDIARDIEQNFLNIEDSEEIRRNNYIFAASHRWQGDYKTALNYYQSIYEYSKDNKDSIDIAKSGHFIGTINMFLGNNVVSQNHLLEVANIYDKIGSAEQKARINNTLAGFYLNIDQLEKGKDQYLLALSQFEKLNDSTGMASANANLGLLYTELGEFDKAEMHLMKQKSLNKVFPTLREMGFHHDFLGLLRQEQGRLEEAYQEHLKALDIRENLSSTYNLCESKLNMGEVLIKLKRYPEAIEQLNDIFRYDEHQSLYQQQTAYNLLSEAYEKSGRHKDALENFKAYKKISDSIYSEESLEVIAEKDAQYERQKKDAEIELLNKEGEVTKANLSRSKVILIGTIICLVLFLIVVIALYKLYTKIKSKNYIITKALKDRELLLHETHHRVKNNLQMISSLLNLQSKYVEDKKAFEVLQNGRNRVESMAILHKNLYAGEDLNMVNLQTYFEGLAQSIFNSYHKSDKEFSVKVKAKNILMNVESVIPVGLIVNELVTNSLKHAFPKGQIEQPEIIIEMTESNSDYCLIVKDNGIGINDAILQKTATESFGQRLIQSLTKKLKAKIEVKNDSGTQVFVTIPKKKTSVVID
ncbi:histidine kinase dimerization/phosphoacceptor domain -containing protein [Winogradskyella sp. SYSU M77433]|uniref:tetratricopeptide repeat-containing sensor histidine kinase n=1 Tax=Winogradskyella sp. SYSU M77433 TaxID=3042722 RepID=UPI00248133B9|nr:histidine kinase dimerization/phosphoacceptor domain -containing protein [Winogradskyella sp. SYSU M77433]MDH7913339.1 histidine kinase dimerization/phosphoacceptor domain -containing protein [Winogradskyella sp. SYSU M77433]